MKKVLTFYFTFAVVFYEILNNFHKIDFVAANTEKWKNSRYGNLRVDHPQTPSTNLVWKAKFFVPKRFPRLFCLFWIIFCTFWLYYYKMDTKAIVKKKFDSDSEDIEGFQEIQIENDGIETKSVNFNIV